MNAFQSVMDAFLAVNPRPTPLQAREFQHSLGISDFECPHFTEHLLSASVKRSKLCALTESERVLINDYNPALTETDNLLINDGDNMNDETSIGNQDALRQDGIVDDSSVDEFEEINRERF